MSFGSLFRLCFGLISGINNTGHWISFLRFVCDFVLIVVQPHNPFQERIEELADSDVLIHLPQTTLNCKFVILYRTLPVTYVIFVSLFHLSSVAVRILGL